MALSASGPEDRVEQMIMLTERLTELIAEQSRAFEERRPQDAAATIDESARLANLYRHESMRIRGMPDMIAGASSELRQRLLVSTEAFDAVLARHGRAVQAAKTVTDGLVKAIADEVASQRSRTSPYGQGLAISQQNTSTAITLNKSA
jgi:hypothetical protein